MTIRDKLVRLTPSAALVLGIFHIFPKLFIHCELSKLQRVLFNNLIVVAREDQRPKFVCLEFLETVVHVSVDWLSHPHN